MHFLNEMLLNILGYLIVTGTYIFKNKKKRATTKLAIFCNLNYGK